MRTDISDEIVGSPHFSPRRTIKPINFFYKAPEAKTVYLMGDFNQWNPNSDPMQRQEDGWWSLQAPLKHGYHEYVFVVDGKPKLDPRATGTARNARYEKVSLVAVS